MPAAATAVHDAWRAATLIGMDTVETVERLAREHLAAQLRRHRLIAYLRREETQLRLEVKQATERKSAAWTRSSPASAFNQERSGTGGRTSRR